MFVSLLLFASLAASASEGRDFQRTWLGVFSKKNFHDAWSAWQELQFRYDSNEGGMLQTLIRVGALRQLSPEHELGLIMGYVQTGLKKEYRPTLQHFYTPGSAGGFHFQLRSRLEFRDVEDEEANSLRYRLFASGRYQLTPKHAALLWNEAFVTLSSEDWTGQRRYERNRLFAGVRIDEQTHRWEIGYLHQLVPRHERTTHEHVLTVYFFY